MEDPVPVPRESRDSTVSVGPWDGMINGRIGHECEFEAPQNRNARAHTMGRARDMSGKKRIGTGRMNYCAVLTLLQNHAAKLSVAPAIVPGRRNGTRVTVRLRAARTILRLR